MTDCVPVPVRAAITQRSPPFPARAIACVVESLVDMTCVVSAFTSAGAIGLMALISAIRSLRTVFQNVQFQPSPLSPAFQHRLMLPP